MWIGAWDADPEPPESPRSLDPVVETELDHLTAWVQCAVHAEAAAALFLAD